MWALALATVASFVVALDLLIVTTALDSIRRDLGSSISTLQWTLTAYSLTFAVLLLTGAALGDRFGRRRMFAAGLALFVVGSTAAALSNSIGMLIASRAVEGAGAAVIVPLALTIVSAAFPVERRGTAIGILEGVAGLAVIAGPVLGGLITQRLAWSGSSGSTSPSASSRSLSSWPESLRPTDLTSPSTAVASRSPPALRSA